MAYSSIFCIINRLFNARLYSVYKDTFMKKIIGAIGFSVLAVWALSSSELSIKEKGELVAYRGGGQLLDYTAMNNQSCSAEHVIKSDNKVIENTLQGIDVAVAKGLKTIHLNIHQTKDKQFVVFHDWKVDCATNGKGDTAGMSLLELQALDAGYGYTFDSGKTHPWRGKGITMPSLAQVIKRYPHLDYWLNLKSNNKAAVDLLHELVQNLVKDSALAISESQFTLISTKPLSQYFRGLSPNYIATSVAETKSCFIDYMMKGWSRFYPESCKNTILMIPPSKAKYLWGWPKQFAAHAQANNSRVFLWGTHQAIKPGQHLTEQGIGIISGDLSHF